MTGTFLTGMLASFALIIAIGAQNAFVLRQGLRREVLWPVVAICAISDAVLIVAGTLGIGAVVERAPAVLDVVRWLGVAFLVAYGIGALRRAIRPSALEAAHGPSRPLRSTLVHAVALTWLNPHVYLDTVLLLGSLANQHGPGGRWWFSAGAAFASLVWFVGLGAGARAAGGWFSSPRAWRAIDLFVAATMFVVAGLLALGS
ncbi:MAG: Lysine exporter protein [Thermoleophilia bacterium]|nr:Lysine exporter protein [Thermoleophilia bacterium]